MTQWLTSLLLVLATVLVVKAFGVGSRATSPMERAFEDVRSLQRGTSIFEQRRAKRSATGGVPCVTVDFLSELKDRFVQWLDGNNDGRASFQEVRDYMRRFKPNVEDRAVEAFIRRRDSDGSGAIDFVPEYVRDLSAPDYTLEAASEWFHLQDTDDDGLVTEQELINMAKVLGMSEDQARENARGYYMSADQNGDGKLSFNEFKTLYGQ